LGFLYRGELLLRRKEIVRRRFLRIGRNDQRLRHGQWIPASKTLSRGGLTNIKVPPVSEFRSAKYFLYSGLRFPEILI
jgi:hypothetical protein